MMLNSSITPMLIEVQQIVTKEIGYSMVATGFNSEKLNTSCYFGVLVTSRGASPLLRRQS